jgi:O-methyltransferase involved in polyketide biosynthesis
MKPAILHRLWKEPVRLTGVSETLLIPLWARAVETRRPDAIIRDPIALEIFENLDYDFSKFEGAWMTQTGIAVRTKILDEGTAAFIREHPRAVVINLGAGLSTRFSRLDNGSIQWVEIDLPDVIALRRLFFRETKRYRCIAGSVTAPDTFDAVETGRQPVLILAEGLFMYFAEEEVRAVFECLSNRFPGAHMLLEMLAPCALGLGKYDPCLSRIARGSLEFRWALGDCRDLESWGCGLKVLGESNVLEHHRERWGWLNFFPPQAMAVLGNRIVHLHVARE